MNLNSGFLNKISGLERFSLLAINIATYMCYGILGGSFGVSLQTLKRLFGFEMNQLSIGLSMQAVGGCLSAILASFTLDKFNRQKQLCVVTLFLSFITISFPFSPNFAIFLIINVSVGFLCTFIDCIENAWIIELTRPKDHVYLQILHFHYSLGTVISPFLLGPFLDPEDKSEDETNNLSEFVSINNTNSEYFLDKTMQLDSNFNATIPSSLMHISGQMEKSQIWKPLVALGLVILTCSILHFIAFFIKPYRELEKKPKLSERQNQSVTSISEHDLNNNSSFNKSSNNLIYQPEKKSNQLTKNYKLLFVFMIIIIVTFEVGNETNATNFLPSFLKKSTLNLNDKQSAYVFAILQFMITITRFVNIFLSFKVNTVLNLYFNFTAMLTGTIILLLFSSKSLSFVEVGIGFLGLGYSSTYPLIITFVEQRLTLTNRISSIMAFSSVVGLILSPLLIGGLIENNPITFVYVTFGVTIISITLFSTLYLMEVFRLRKR